MTNSQLSFVSRRHSVMVAVIRFRPRGAAADNLDDLPPSSRSSPNLDVMGSINVGAVQ